MPEIPSENPLTGSCSCSSFVLVLENWAQKRGRQFSFFFGEAVNVRPSPGALQSCRWQIRLGARRSVIAGEAVTEVHTLQSVVFAEPKLITDNLRMVRPVTGCIPRLTVAKRVERRIHPAGRRSTEPTAG